MKIQPKIILGLILLLIIIICAPALFFLWQKRPLNSISITSSQNKFHLTFSILPKDKETFSKFLENLNVSQNVQEGATFSLDSTSSARITFLTPISTNFNIEGSTINYKGNLSFRPNLQSSTPQNLDIPNSANLEIFSHNLTSFIISRYNFDQKFSAWITANFGSVNPQYLIFLGDKPDFILATRTESINLQSLKDLNLGSDNYKEDTIGNSTLYLLNFKNQDQTAIQPALFSQNGWTFFASNQDSAQKIFDAQNGKNKKSFFERNQLGSPINLIINFQSENISANFTKIFQITPDTTNIPSNVQKTLSKINKFTFLLKADTFSGLISSK